MTPLDQLEELLHERTCSPEEVCALLVPIFGIRPTEVGLLSLVGDHLCFLYPTELRSAGTIPLSSSAVAARTAVSREAEIYNRFVHVPHHVVFEAVRLDEPDAAEANTPSTIQKLMSAPLIGEDDRVVGVVQVSRKGATPALAGADFTPGDLDTLVRAARRIALLMPELLAAGHSGRKSLRFYNTLSGKKFLNRV